MKARPWHRLASFVGRRIAAYDEMQAQADEEGKDAGPFRLGNFLEGPLSAFLDIDQEQPPGVKRLVDGLLDYAVPLYLADPQLTRVQLSGSEGKFQSLISEGTSNDTARFSYFPARGSQKSAVVIMHHWNANPDKYNVFGKIFSLLGISAVVMTLPYHGQRGDGNAVANRFLNADVGGSARSVIQAVSDAQVIIHWLKSAGVRQIGVLGVSLGSCVAALTAAFNPDVRAAALLLTAGDFASVVWSGRATRHIRKAMDSQISLKSLQLFWSIISPTTFIYNFASSDVKVLILSGSYDQVVLPELTFEFVNQLRRAGVNVIHHCWPCGHYSLALPPFSIVALARSFAFLKNALNETL
jgi:pimeloyl-ACP methyl ester carboxylesterase